MHIGAYHTIFTCSAYMCGRLLLTGSCTSTQCVAQGPTHKKALVKAEAERRRNEALGNMRWAAENASVRLGLAGLHAPPPFDSIRLAVHGRQQSLAGNAAVTCNSKTP